jgi:diguanylate cyclase (GGDEF)-like protein
VGNQSRRDDFGFEAQLRVERRAGLDAESIADPATGGLHEAVQELMRKTTMLELLEAVAKAANEAPSIEEAMQVCLTRICMHTGWPVGHALLVSDRVPPDLASSAVWHLETPERFEEFVQATAGMRFSAGTCLPGRVLATGDPAWISRISEDGNFPRERWATETGLQAAFAFPILVRSEVAAVLEFFSTEASRPNERLLEVMTQAAVQLGRVIERTRSEARLAHLALHDPLTGLPNRALLMDRLGHALARGHRTGSAVNVLFLDIDDFKNINDSLGHATGDDVLMAVAQRLQTCARAADTVARLGGDEFCVLLENAADPVLVARRHAHALRSPIILDGKEIFVSVSMGIASGASGQWHADELLHAADVAMHEAKARGKNRYVVFEPVMQSAVLERHELRTSLRRALEARELIVHYQPAIRLADGRVLGVEALLRWQHPVRGLIGPCDFIPLAEETGLIVDIGAWVLGEACRFIAACEAADPRIPLAFASVNLSGRQLKESDFANVVASVLSETGVDASRLCVEVTEAVLMDSAQSTIASVAALKELGVTLAIDDFGTGCSSLSYLGRLRIDVLKIDRPLVAALPNDHDDGRIVSALIGLGHSLGMAVVAEGVETDDQRTVLSQLGCDAAQGYLFSPPQPGDELIELFAGRRLRRQARVP